MPILERFKIFPNQRKLRRPRPESCKKRCSLDESSKYLCCKKSCVGVYIDVVDNQYAVRNYNSQGPCFLIFFVNLFEPFVASTSGRAPKWGNLKLVETYTHCDLSYQSDKLPSLSAIAERFGQGAGFEEQDYFTGHWRRHLPHSLLWVQKRLLSYRENFEIAKDPRSSLHGNALSWLWASQDRALEVFQYPPQHCVRDSYRMCEFDCHAILLDDGKVLHATDVLKTSNLFSKVNSGAFDSSRCGARQYLLSH